MKCLYRLSLSFSVVFVLVGCGESLESSLPAPGPYAGEELWACKPGAVSNRCLELDQTTTYVYSDTSFAVFEHNVAVDPEFDCFYVYPTVDYGQQPGNTTDLSDDSLVLRPLYDQAARFTELCSVYAPLYRQMTIATYGVEEGYRNSKYFDIAFGDVDAAFSQYLLESGDRPFVLIGHSQGSHMLLELLKQRFDNDPALRERLVSALLIGPVGELKVPAGAIVGGSFANIPLCTRATDTACIIAYDSVAAGDSEREPVDNPIPCVDPTRLGGNPGILENTIWGADNGLPFPDSLDTPWIAYPGMHTAECAADGFLVLDTVQEDRKPPLSPQALQVFLASSTLHIADVNFALGDLLRVVASQAESMPGR